MAHMIPESAPGFGPGQKAEKALFESLANHLDDRFFVYHRLSYHESGRAGEGEIDFLVVHREHGLLAIECKGRGVRRDGQGRWWRIVGDAGEEESTKNPWKQAQQQVRDLTDLMDRRMATIFPGRSGLPFIFGHAVAFPLAKGSQLNLPLDADSQLLIDCEDLAGIDRRIEELFRHWRTGRSRTPLNEAEFKRFRKNVLHPILKIVPTMGGRIASDEQTFLRLSRQQCQVLDAVVANPRFRVTGGAGTGKTVLAFEATRKLADRGAKVLFLCYNRPLADLATDSLPAVEDGGPMQANNFHGLCHMAFLKLGRTYDPPSPQDKQASRQFWEHDAPEALLDAVTSNLMPRFDAIVVDEAQDLASEWWELVYSLLRDPKQGHLILFEDPAQEIFGRGSAVPQDLFTLSLGRNYRNTKRIGEVVRKLGRVEMEPHPECPEGEYPSTFALESPTRNVQKLTELLTELIEKQQVNPEQIVILTPHSRPHSSLADMDTLGNYPLAEKPQARKGLVLHTTIGRFKGLESDIVILCDVDIKDPRSNRNALYVAASRAKHALYVLARGDWQGV